MGIPNILVLVLSPSRKTQAPPPPNMNPNSFKPEGPFNPEPEPSARHGTLAEARSEAAASLEPGGRVQGSFGLWVHWDLEFQGL